LAGIAGAEVVGLAGGRTRMKFCVGLAGASPAANATDEVRAVVIAKDRIARVRMM